jgi:hypothetical protein
LRRPCSVSMYVEGPLLAVPVEQTGKPPRINYTAVRMLQSQSLSNQRCYISSTQALYSWAEMHDHMHHHTWHMCLWTRVRLEVAALSTDIFCIEHVALSPVSSLYGRNFSGDIMPLNCCGSLTFDLNRAREGPLAIGHCCGPFDSFRSPVSVKPRHHYQCGHHSVPWAVARGLPQHWQQATASLTASMPRESTACLAITTSAARPDGPAHYTVRPLRPAGRAQTVSLGSSHTAATAR